VTREFIFSLPIVVTLSVIGCSMPPGMNDTCNWPTEPLRTQKQTDQQDLVADVRIAEELAMRYADAHADSRGAHSRLRSECEAKLFDVLAQSHGVPLAKISQARQQLDRAAWDAAVHLPLGVGYVAAAIFLARRIRRRFPRDEKIPAVVATLIASVAIGVVFVVLGHLWDGLIEMIRLGNTHMSYRAERLGWREHSEKVFALAVLLFWCVVLASYQARWPVARSPEESDMSR